MVDTPTLHFLPKSRSILSRANLTPLYPCFACSASLCHSHRCWSWPSGRQGITMPATSALGASTTTSFHRPLLQLGTHTNVAAVLWSSLKGEHISSIPYHLQTLPPIELYATFTSSTPLSKHTGHFHCLRHSLSIKLFPLSFPTMWRRVKLLQLSVLSPSLFPEARPLKVGANITKKNSRREPQEGTNPTPPTMDRSVWFRLLDSSRTVRLLCDPVLDGFSLSCIHSSPTPSQVTLIFSSSMLSPLEVFL
jgi:hypothetical protein